MCRHQCCTLLRQSFRFGSQKCKKIFSNDPELRDLSKKCKHAWKRWKKAGQPSEGPEYEEKKSLSPLTKQCAYKCHATIDRKLWKERGKMFRSKDLKCFRTPSNLPSLGDRLLYGGEITSDPDIIQSCWLDHFKTLLQSEPNSNLNLSVTQATSLSATKTNLQHLEFLSRMNHDDIIDDDFTIEEIEASIKKLKPGKAEGIEGLQSEHLKFGGPLLTLWLKQIFCAFIKLEQIPSSLLTSIICPIYKGKGKDPLSCNSYRGITITSALTKVFEYTILNRLLPVLQDSCHPALTQTAYQKGISCQDAIFTTQEAILHNLRDGRVSYLSLYDLEKAFDSIDHSVLLQSLFEAGINGRAWRLIQACYSNLTAVVKSGSDLSSPFAVSRGVQQGSVLSPTFFIIVMDKLLQQLKKTSAGLSICGLYLGGAAHADDVRAIAPSASAAEEQGQIIQNFAAENYLKLNREKTEIVRISQSKSCEKHNLQVLDLKIETAPHASCLGYTWSHNLSARRGVESNINKARQQFFALGSSGGFLGYSNPLSAREVLEICIIPTLLYGAENWILDEGCLALLECFQAEIGRRILKLSRYHSRLAVQIGLSLPSVTARVLTRKISYLYHLLLSEDKSIATSTFRILVSQNVYNMSLVQQCIFLDSKLKTNCTAQILGDVNNTSPNIKKLKESIISTDRQLILDDACKHQPVTLASEINWLRVWEAARDKGPYWTNVAQSFYRILTRPLFGDRVCNKCDSVIQEDTSYFSHLTQTHVPSTVDISRLLTDLRSHDSDPVTISFHCMKLLVSLTHTTSHPAS